MIYCSLEPGLLTLAGLKPYETSTAFAVVTSLLLHRDALKRSKARIPVTDQFITSILYDLDKVPIQNPPLQKTLKELILDVLARQVRPSLAPAGLPNTEINPDITSLWVANDIKERWFDSLTAAIMDLLQGENSETNATLAIATWLRDGLPFEVTISNAEFHTYLANKQTNWPIPLITTEHDWTALRVRQQDWPNGIEIIVESYARRYLGISLEAIGERRQFRFERSCWRAISEESSIEIREKMVEVLACRAYNQLQSHHNNEAVEGQHAVWRVYVKKMTPAVRLHYIFDGDEVVYTLYTNADHDRGLR